MTCSTALVSGSSRGSRHTGAGGLGVEDTGAASDDDDELGLVEGVVAGRAEDEGLEDLVVEGRAESAGSVILDTAEEVDGGVVRVDAVALDRRVDEADLTDRQLCSREGSNSHSIVVKEGSSVGNLGKSPGFRQYHSNSSNSLPEVVDALAALLAAHGRRVVAEDNNVKEGKLAEVNGNVGGQVPVGADLGDGVVGNNTLGDGIDSTGVTVKGTNALLRTRLAVPTTVLST